MRRSKRREQRLSNLQEGTSIGRQMVIGEKMQDKKSKHRQKRQDSCKRKQHYDFSVFNDYKCNGQLSFEFNHDGVKIVEDR